MTNWAAVSDRSPATVIEPVPWASITYERFREWWSSLPLGLSALFFRNRVMGAIGIWSLSDHLGVIQGAESRIVSDGLLLLGDRRLPFAVEFESPNAPTAPR